jgi:hypothetical protein
MKLKKHSLLVNAFSLVCIWFEYLTLNQILIFNILDF